MDGLALCAGIGGLELGLDLALGGSYRTVGYVEREAYSAATLVARMAESRLGAAPIWDDLATFDGRPWRGSVDIIAAGFPCQPFSAAGSKLGKLDDRWLWPSVERIIREVRPGFVFLENVPPLVRHGLDSVLGSLAELGFDAEWDVFSAAGVGAPHLRRRLFLLARNVSNTGSDPLRNLAERRQGAAQAAERGDSEPRDVGGSLADSGGERLEGKQQARPTSWAARRSGGSQVGDSDSRGREEQRQPERAGIEGERRPLADGHDSDGRLLWPPGPQDSDGWRDYIGAGGPEPAVRRGADGTSAALEFRTDRLRACGNGVVPLEAAYAFSTLAARGGWA